MSTHNPPTVTKARSEIMIGRRVHDPEREASGRRDLAEAKIAAYIEKALAVAPPLNNQQIHRLTGLLRAGGVR
ncbi:hypothetical protein RZO50_03860 [Microbacterium sp. SSW1-59]|uniref:hypothetical protein n=1 Tax=Microbacterium xanthum TaxID=3079794 RepID=UPI002AD267B5|nr:hypothetical protein [Microbacterium sp. SSW1-59]MDZ8200633.1 hypothetical protein [Microbacterium sp. SSW1-59]